MRDGNETVTGVSWRHGVGSIVERRVRTPARRRRLDRFLIALPDSISEGEEGSQDGPVN